ncbi:MAG TPA: hypothetical protein VFX21_13530 [Acidimicrobiia bacterium]|nr:hypothetical protein [Acidimicrobiia bacterium]
MEGTGATTTRAAAHAGWPGVGRFSSDPMWYPVSLYPVGEALLVHRRRAGIIAEARRSIGGHVTVDEHVYGTLVTMYDRDGMVGRVLVGPRTSVVEDLRTRGWIRGVAAGNRAYSCKVTTPGAARATRGFLEVEPAELRLTLGSSAPIVLRADEGAVVEGERNVRRVFLTLATPYRTHATIVVGRTDPLIAALQRTGWVD